MPGSIQTAIAVMLFTCSAGAQKTSQGINFYSVQREIADGRRAAAELAAKLPPLHDPALESYAERIGGVIARGADSRFSYAFAMFDDRQPWSGNLRLATPAQRDTAEPIAIAGGAVFVPASLLASAPNEAAFAFQLAHAVAHIALRHATRSETRAELMEIGMEQIPALDESALLRMGVPIAELSFARRSELQADGLAAALTAAAGYDPRLVIPYLEGLPEERPQALADHPIGVKRAAAVRAAIASLPAQGYTAATGDFEPMKARAAAK